MLTSVVAGLSNWMKYGFSICPYAFSCKLFVKSDFYVYSHLEHSSDKNKKGLHVFPTL